MPLSRGILCAGCVVVDVNKVIDAYPARDHLASILDVSLCTGGPGLNLAVDLARLGAGFPIAVAGVVGDDVHGAFIREECAALGIDVTGLVTRAGAVTSFTDAMVERDGGRRTFFHHVGANALLEPGIVLAEIERLAPRIVHLGSPGLHPAMDAPAPDGGNGWSAVLRAATEAGAQTNLELVDLPAPRLRELALPCLPHLDTIVVNELEAAALTEREPPASNVGDEIDWGALEVIAQEVVRRGIRRLAVVHFPAGCVAADRDGRTWRHGSVRMPPARVRGTTGAGDAFAAGVLFARYAGEPVDACLRLGVAAAAACLTEVGTTSGVRSAAECLADAAAFGHHPA
ncbi:MAG: carbohydrate kinase family protein [Dermatophilaceae bacterium]